MASAFIPITTLMWQGVSSWWEGWGKRTRDRVRHNPLLTFSLRTRKLTLWPQSCLEVLYLNWPLFQTIIRYPIQEGGHTKATMTRPNSSSSPTAAVVGQKTASQAWQQLCTGWLADNKDAAHAHAGKQVWRACVDRTDCAHAYTWRGRRKAALQGRGKATQ